MNRILLSLVVAFSIAFTFIGSLIGAEHQAATSAQVQQEFRLLDGVMSADRAAAIHVPADLALHDFIAKDFAQPYRLENSHARVVLRPAGASHIAPASDAGSSIYRNAFRGVDVVRRGGTLGAEIFVLRDANAAKAIAYEVADRSGVAEIVPDGRGVRFLGFAAGSDLAISGPLLIDASGMPSQAARWTIDRTVKGHTLLHLRVDDIRLHYPVTVLATPGAAASMRALTVARTSTLARSFRTQVDGVGSISGTVVDSSTAAPISGALCFAFDSGDNFVALATTDGSGAYSITGLDTGTYYIFVLADDYVGTLYANIPCPDGSCDPASGTGIGVVDGSDTPGINFALTGVNARVTGQITDSSSNPLAGVNVVLYDGSGNTLGFGSSDGSGNYVAETSFDGNVFVRTMNTANAGFIDQLYNGIDCSGCDVTTGTPVAISVGTTHANVNFALHGNGGGISGRLSDGATSSALPFQTVRIYSSLGIIADEETTDIDGNYATIPGLANGNYYVYASVPGYQPQLYNGVSCPSGCNVTTGTAVAVTTGVTRTNIDLTLQTLAAHVTGQVTDSADSSPLGGVLVLFHQSPSDVPIGVYSSYVDGSYAIDLPNGGTWFAQTQNSIYPGLLDQLYNGIDCSGCSTAGTPIATSSGATTPNIDFALHHGGFTLSGHVTDAFTHAAVANATVQIYGASGAFVTYATTDGNGAYTSVQSVAPGSYYAIAFATGYDDQLYAGLSCVGCDPTTGSAIPVTTGNVVSIDFAMSSNAARIAGRITDASNGTPLPGVSVNIYDSLGQLVTNAIADSTGAYQIALASAGTYYANTVNNLYPTLADQLYDHIPCSGCDPLSGTPINATIGVVVPNIDFPLTAAACTTINIQPASLPDATGGSPYSQPLTASGAAAPLVWSVVSGSLPPGLSLDSSTGIISGTPTAGGISTFAVSVTDANSCTAGRTYTLDVPTTPTTTTLTASPSTVTYGQSVLLTASVAPSVADGTVSFLDGLTLLGTATLSGGSASISVTLMAGTHDITANYGGSASYSASTSAPIHVIVNRATPTISWATPAAITYGTPLPATQLNATASVPGTFVYTPPAGTVLNAGAQTLSVSFTPTDSIDYNTASKSVTIVVNKANQTIVWPAPANIGYGTPLSSTQLDATVSVPGPSPAGALTYNPAAGTVLTIGTHTLSVTAAATSNYNVASASVTIHVTKGNPTFSNLSSPTIVISTIATTISGSIHSGVLVPPGFVTITLAGSPQIALIQSDGSFSATFVTFLLAPSTAGYPIGFSYGGSSNFNSASATSTLIVSYATAGGTTSPGPFAAGSTITFRVQARNALNLNVSSLLLPVTAYGVRLVSSSSWLPAHSASGSAQFQYQLVDLGSYRFDLLSSGLAPGNYVLGYKIGNDPVIHTATFTLN